jgi:tetratricopeptide (TPR) repeat protein
VPPPAPRACFGRSELIGRIVDLAETLTPIALVGAGGIGKTSIALAVLHHDRIKQRFGDNRRFIRCDQFPASRANFLHRLSRVIGAGVGNPEDLAPLRSSLTSKEMLIVLDNAESILDPQGVSGQEINIIVEELSQFNNICLCITSRITTVPPDCKTLEVPTLSMEAARHVFYRIYGYGSQSDSIDNTLEQLAFHPLSVTLLATVAHQNKWDDARLIREWTQRQTGVLQTEYNKSLARTIELSLNSPMFKELGPHARGLLEVVAFFPQGIDEKNFNWLFPTIPNRTAIFDTFCVLSMTYRNNGFIRMLAPLRDYLRPHDPMSSPLLSATKNRYFARMSIQFDRNTSVFQESRWIMSEDVNVEHLLDVFTSVDANADEIWGACANFMTHLYWHKPRFTLLRQKVESLSDDHWSKSKCLFELAQLFKSVGNYVERKRRLNKILELVREQGDENSVAHILRELSDANRMLGFYKEGIEQARKALEIYQRLGTTAGQARCLSYLAFLLYEDKQLEAAKEAASHVMDLLPKKGQEFLVCQSQRLLGNIHRSKGQRERAIYHCQVALEIASPFEWHAQLFWIHYVLAVLYLGEREFDGAQAHIEKAKFHAAENQYYLGHAMHLQAQIWCRQGKLREARSEASRAFEIFEKLDVADGYLNRCRAFLQKIERAMKSQSASDAYGQFLKPMFLPMPVNFPFLVYDQSFTSSVIA